MVNSTSTILIVDDEPAMREALGELLEEEGYALAFARNGAEALIQAAGIIPDLVLMDVVMPEMNGIEACRRLRADPLLAQVPVIMVTTRGDRASRLAGIEAGADDFVVKPVDVVELLARVRTTTRLNRYRLLLQEQTRRQKAESQRDAALEELQAHAERLRTLREVDRALLTVRSGPEVARVALGHVWKLVACSWASVTIFDLSAGTATILAAEGDLEDGLAVGDRLPLDPALLDTLRQERVAVIEDVNRDPPESVGPPTTDMLRKWRVRSFSSVPLLSRGELLGSLNLGSKSPGVLGPEQMEIAREVADQLAIVLQQTRLREQVERHAADLERQVVDRTRELQTLYGVTAVASESLDLQAVLDQSLEQSLAAVKCGIGAIQLAEGIGGELRLAAQQGIPPHVVSLLTALPAGGGAWASWVVENARPLVVPDMSIDARTPEAARSSVPFPYVGVPMRSQSRVVGVVSVVGETGQQFSAEEVALLASIADHVAVAVENARLREQAERTAVLEERERLARELHDSVTQLLYSLGLYAETGHRLAAAGEMQGVSDYLRRIGNTAQQALKEMRVLIYELRPPLLEQEGLVGALQARLDSVERRSGVDADLLVEGKVELPARTEAELYHIAQEALNNALRHAAAAKVIVRIRASRDAVELKVVDDGVGFDAAETGGLGLIGMAERAERVGGTLEVISKVGEGTSVKVAINDQRSAED